MTGTLAAPACAQDTGSWCARLWRWTGLEWLSANYEVILHRGLSILIIVVVALIVRRLAHRGIGKLLNPATTPRGLRQVQAATATVLIGDGADTRRTERAAAVASMLKSVVSFIIVTVALIAILAQLGIDVGPLIASAGIAGVALGIGAQSLVRDFLSGVFLTMEDQFGIGDTVDLGPASGTVIDVGLRITTVRGADGTVWHVRNGEILRVGNSSKGTAVVQVDIPVDYQADEERVGAVALAALREVAESEEFAGSVVAEPSLAGVIALGTSCVTVRVQASVEPPVKAAFAMAARTAIKRALDDAEIPVSADVNWHGGDRPE